MKFWWIFVLWLPLYAAETVPNRYIVELNTEPVAEHIARTTSRGARKLAMQGTEARQHRARLRTEQQRARGGVEAGGATVLDSVDTVANALLVEIPDAQAARLSGVAGVRRVIPVRRARKMLDHAVPLHKVPEAWNLVGYDKAGAGVKIAIIDSGIDISHPGFQDASMAAPPGFPKTNISTDEAFTNGKVIVARSYATLFTSSDPNSSAKDVDGHGTATAMTAAGARNTGPLASITGVAPKAWLGNYKIFGTPGVNDNPPFDVLLKAVDDAVADGMDVINLSLGSELAPLPEDDELVQALERAASLGVIVTVSAGNSGPDPNTIASPATGPSVIAVGASSNDRQFSASATVGGTGYLAVPATNSRPDPVSGPLADVAAVDGNGLACSSLPAGSLAGTIAFILRGVCFFEDKMNNAQAAGAIGALVYSDKDRPDATGMDTGASRLPAEMVSYPDGLEIKGRVAGGLLATLRFSLGPVSVSPDRIASFSARGPNVDSAVKPDLLAVGTSIYTAAESSNPAGLVYSPDGYADIDGTSFSAPLVAGAAALLKSARPGLSAAQYRSLLVNSASAASLRPGTSATAQQAGAGVLDMAAAVRSTLAAAPVSLSFGVGGGDTNVSRTLTLSNVGTARETYLISVLPRAGAPAPQLPGTVQLDPGASIDLPVAFSGAGLQPGAYEGTIIAQGSTSGVESHIPYWYAVGPGAAAGIAVLYQQDQPRAGSTVRDAVLFRVTDAAGVPLRDILPEVTVVSGGGSAGAVRSRSQFYPGVWSASLTFGQRGANVFRIEVQGITKDVTIVTR